jgi:uncharacterized membrane-anchored protein
MQKNVGSANEERRKAGHEPVHSIGWAKAPRYDSHTQAILGEGGEIRFTAGQHAQLQYTNAWRGGMLVLNGVAAMSQLPEIEQVTPKILAAIRLQSGTSIR